MSRALLVAELATRRSIPIIQLPGKTQSPGQPAPAAYLSHKNKNLSGAVTVFPGYDSYLDHVCLVL